MSRTKQFRPGALVRLRPCRDHVNAERCAWLEKFRHASWKDRALNSDSCLLRLRKSMIGMFVRGTNSLDYGEFLFEESLVLVAYSFLEEV